SVSNLRFDPPSPTRGEGQRWQSIGKKRNAPTRTPSPLEGEGGSRSETDEGALSCRRAPAFALFPEHPAENRIDVLEVIGVVEARIDLGVAELGRDFRVGFQEIGKGAFAAPDFHGVALHGGIAFL